MTVGLLYNKNKKESVRYVKLLTEAIVEISRRESAGRESWNVIDSADYRQDSAAASADLLISIGGDGTFLKTPRAPRTRLSFGNARSADGI